MQEPVEKVDLDLEPLWPLELQADTPTGMKLLVLAAVVGVGFGLLSAAGRILAEASSHIFVFCAADGALAAFLLPRPKKSWWIFLLCAWLGDAISIVMVMRGGVAVSAGVAFCNCLEVLIAALLLQRALVRNRDLASRAFMLQFLLYAVLLAPASAALVASVGYHFAFGSSIRPVFWKWLPSHALGMAVMTPLTLARWNPNLANMFGRDRILQTIATLLLILTASVLAFNEIGDSLIFLLLPLLMLVGFQAGIVGAVAATFEVFVVGAIYTLRGLGPFCMGASATPRSSILLLQFAILVLLVSIVPFAATVERQRKLRAQLYRGLRRYRLLAENSRDIVVLSNLQGRRLYVSPAVEDVVGWTQQEWTDQNSADLMHRDDIERFQRMLNEMLQGEDRRSFRYRTRHKNGQYLWMEANVRTLTDEKTGRPNAYVANVRDISECVESEKKLAEAHQQLEQQAQLDGLTRLPTRRRFDEALEKEWRRGRRTANALALIMVDVDEFKRINHIYGYRAGDQCLQSVAAILGKGARRPGDLCARYDGQQFALLLPDADLLGARMVADLVCIKVREHLFEAGIGRSVTLTVSVGVAALRPATNMRADELVEAADRALQAAKLAGRNRVVSEGEDQAAGAALLHQVR